MCATMVSVVVPAYNAAIVVAEAIDSVLAQTYADIELIVINDGSTDATASVLDRYGDRIQVRHQRNGGLASARNAGMAMARGDYIAWLDADDICLPDRIAAQVAYLEQRPAVGLCSSDFNAFTSAGWRSGPYLSRYYTSVRRSARGLNELYSPVNDMLALPCGAGGSVAPASTRAGQVFENLVKGNFVHPPTVMFRRELLVSSGPLLEELRNLCDYEWFLRASLRSTFGFIDLPLIDYRLSPGQMSSDANTLSVKRDLIRVMRIVEQIKPDFARAHSRQLERRIGDAQLGVGHALWDAGQPGAWAALFAGLNHGASWIDASRLAAKLMAPQALVTWRRARLDEKSQR